MLAKSVGLDGFEHPFLPRDVMHKSGLCRRSVSVRLSVSNVMTILLRGPHNWGKITLFDQYLQGFVIDHCLTVACRQHFDGGVQVLALLHVRLLRSTNAAAPRVSESYLRQKAWTRTQERTYHNLIVRIGESQAELPNNNRLRSRH